MAWRFFFHDESVQAAMAALDPHQLADLKLAKDILVQFGPQALPVTLSRLSDGVAANDDEDAAPGATPKAGAGNALGLVGEDLDAGDRRQLGLKPGEGVGIARVEGSAARNAGLRPGDVVLQVGRASVGSVAALDRELGKVGKDQTAMLLVRRDGATQFVAVSPGGNGE